MIGFLAMKCKCANALYSASYDCSPPLAHRTLRLAFTIYKTPQHNRKPYYTIFLYWNIQEAWFAHQHRLDTRPLNELVLGK